jgi:hypothetical protein
MDKDNLDWKDWVCAYVSFNGLVANAFVGRVVDSGPGRVVLEDAYEYVSISGSPGGPNQGQRTMIGSPIEFVPITRIEINTLALIDLAKLDAASLVPFRATRKAVAEKLANMTVGRPIIQLARQMPPIVGPRKM